MIETLLSDFIEQLREPFCSPNLIDWYLEKCLSAIGESEAYLVESLVEQTWLQQVLAGETKPSYSTLYEKYRCLHFFEAMSASDKQALLTTHAKATDAAQKILREQRGAVHILSLLRDCLTTFAFVTDPHPPVAHFVKTARMLLNQHEQIKVQLSLLTEFNKPVNNEELQSVARMIDEELASVADSVLECEKSMIEFLELLESRIIRSLDTPSRVTISESALLKLLSTMDRVRSLQTQQEEEALIWQARSRVAAKKARQDLAAAALRRSRSHDQRAEAHTRCLKTVERCVHKVRHVQTR